MNWEQWLSVIGSLVILAGAVFVFINGRRANKTTEEKVEAETSHQKFADNLELTRYIDSRVDEKVGPVSAELRETRERLARRDGAFARILRAIANQWSGPAGGPDLDPADIAEVEDTVPRQWIRGGGSPRQS